MTEKPTIKHRIRSFSDNMFRNYQIMRKRWEITNREKKRSAEISRLGSTVYRLFQSDELKRDDLAPQIEKIKKIDLEIKNLEENLRDIIMKADLPRQLAAGPAVKKETPIKKTEPKTVTPVKKNITKDTKPAVKTEQKPVEPVVKNKQKPVETVKKNKVKSDKPAKNEDQHTVELTKKVEKKTVQKQVKARKPLKKSTGINASKPVTEKKRKKTVAKAPVKSVDSSLAKKPKK